MLKENFTVAELIHYVSHEDEDGNDIRGLWHDSLHAESMYVPQLQDEFKYVLYGADDQIVFSFPRLAPGRFFSVPYSYDSWNGTDIEPRNITEVFYKERVVGYYE